MHNFALIGLRPPNYTPTTRTAEFGHSIRRCPLKASNRIIEAVGYSTSPQTYRADKGSERGRIIDFLINWNCILKPVCRHFSNPSYFVYGKGEPFLLSLPKPFLLLHQPGGTKLDLHGQRRQGDHRGLKDRERPHTR